MNVHSVSRTAGNPPPQPCLISRFAGLAFFSFRPRVSLGNATASNVPVSQRTGSSFPLLHTVQGDPPPLLNSYWIKPTPLIAVGEERKTGGPARALGDNVTAAEPELSAALESAGSPFAEGAH